MCLNDRYVRPWNTRKRALARFRCRRCAIYRAKRHVATGFCVSLRCTWSDGMSPEGRVGWHSEPVGAPAPHELHGWERFLCGGCTHRCRTAPRHRLRCNPEHGVTPGADTSGSLTHVTLSCVESTDISAPGTRDAHMAHLRCQRARYISRNGTRHGLLRHRARSIGLRAPRAWLTRPCRSIGPSIGP